MVCESGLDTFENCNVAMATLHKPVNVYGYLNSIYSPTFSEVQTNSCCITAGALSDKDTAFTTLNSEDTSTFTLWSNKDTDVTTDTSKLSWSVSRMHLLIIPHQGQIRLCPSADPSSPSFNQCHWESYLN
jgi:hypothetical protein